MVYGRGTIIGGQGNDTVWVISGTGYGDNPDVSSAAGNDILEANLTDAPNESKALVGGRGADEFRIILAQEDNQISTRAAILDFNGAEGDRVMLDVVNFQGNFVLVGTGNLDTNHDGQLTAGEGPQTRLDPLTGSLVLDLSGEQSCATRSAGVRRNAPKRVDGLLLQQLPEEKIILAIFSPTLPVVNWFSRATPAFQLLTLSTARRAKTRDRPAVNREHVLAYGRADIIRNRDG